MKFVDGIEYESVGTGWKIVKNVSNKDADLVIPNMVDGLPVVDIGSSAFAQCMHLESITLPSTIRNIYDSAFMACRNLKTINESASIFLHNRGRIDFHAMAFVDCESLQEVNVSGEIHLVGNAVFRLCYNLEKIGTLGNVIYHKAPSLSFHECRSLQELTIMQYSTNDIGIGRNAFACCPKLTKLTFMGHNVFCADKPALNSIKRRKIVCPTTCNLVPLAYEGVHITTY